MKKNEIRITPSNLSLREAAPDEKGEKCESRTITGYAIRFNEESLVLDEWGERFTEVILPSACSEDYLRECDIKMTLFHNREKLLARSNKGEGSLRLFVDKEGVGFEFDAPDTELGKFALEGVKRGDLNGCSFTFAPGDYEVDRETTPITIKHRTFSWLGEMTIGSDPAYPTTSVNVRELSGKPNDESQTIENEAKQRELAIAELTKRFNSIFQ